MKAPTPNSNVAGFMDSSPALASTSVSEGKLQAADYRPKCRSCHRVGIMAPHVHVWVWIAMSSLTAFFSTVALVCFTVGGTHADLAVLYEDGRETHGGKSACMPAGILGLLYASGYAQALPVLVLVAAWFLAVQPSKVFNLHSAERLHACRTFAVMLPCAALVALQPLVIISWAAFGGDMKRWEIDGRRYDAETHTWTGPNGEGGYECCASELLFWGSRQTTWAQCSCVSGFVACAWYLLLGACFAVMPFKPRLLRAVFGPLPEDDGEDVAAAAADGSEERLCVAKDTDSVAEDPDGVIDLIVEEGVTKPGAREAS